ncbi:MAG TPA: hypothetical protein VGF06_17890 [Terriglobales bacterium]|jgi:hypothetical protein
MVLIVSFLLALLPLVGVAWIFFNGEPFTVDGLFMALILLTISAICGMTGLYELRRRMSPHGKSGGASVRRSPSGGLVQKGTVQSVEFYESNVGQPNKSVVTLLDAPHPATLLVFEGDLRNALPVGRKVEVTMRKEIGYHVLVNVNYA